MWPIITHLAAFGGGALLVLFVKVTAKSIAVTRQPGRGETPRPNATDIELAMAAEWMDEERRRILTGEPAWNDASEPPPPLNGTQTSDVVEVGVKSGLRALGWYSFEHQSWRAAGRPHPVSISVERWRVAPPKTDALALSLVSNIKETYDA